MSSETEHLAKLVKYVLNPNTFTEIERHEVSPLRILSLIKLSFMFPSCQDLYAFISKCPLIELKSVILKEIEYGREYVCYHFKDSSNSKFSTLTLEPDGVLLSLKRLNFSNQSRNISNERTLCCSDVQKNNLYEKSGSSYCSLEKEIDKPRGELDLGNTVSISKNLQSSAILFHAGITPSLNIQNDSSSEESDEANLPLKQAHEPKQSDDVCVPVKDEAGKLVQMLPSCFAITSYDSHLYTDALKKRIRFSSHIQQDNFSEVSDKAYSPLIEETDQKVSTLNLPFFPEAIPDLCSGIEMTSKFILSDLETHSQKSKEYVQINHPTEEANDIPQCKCLQAKMRTSVENSEAANCSYRELIDLIEAEHLRIQTLHKNYTTANSLVQEKLPKDEDSKAQKEYSVDFDLKSIPEAKNFKCEDSKIRNEYLEEPDQGNYSAEKRRHLQFREESEFLEHPQAIHPEGEKDFLKSEYSKIKMDSAEKQRKFDDSLKEMLSSAFCFLCEFEENTPSGTKLPNGEDSKTQKEYSVDFDLKSILEAKNFKCEDSKIQNEYLEEPDQGNYSAEKGTYLQFCEGSEFREHPQAIHPDEAEKDFLKSEYSKIKIDSAEKQENDDCLTEVLSSVFDFLYKLELNTSCIEKQDLIFNPQVKSEDIHSKFCVKSVRILLYLLGDAKKNLQYQEDKANRLKHDFETKVKKLKTWDLENIKDSEELLKTANNLVRSCDKLLVNLVKDKVECEWYSENLQHMLNFFQEKCVLGNLVI